MKREIFIIEGQSVEESFNNFVTGGRVSGEYTLGESVLNPSDKYTATVEKQATEFAKLVRVPSNVVNYIDLGPKGFAATTVTRVPVENVSTKPVFYIEDASNNEEVLIKGFENGFESKSEAEVAAINLTLENLSKEYVVLKTTSSNPGGGETVTTFKKVVQTYKSRPKLTDLKNRVLTSTNAYLFFFDTPDVLEEVAADNDNNSDEDFEDSID